MRQKIKLSIGVVAVVLFALLAVNSVMAPTLTSAMNKGIMEDETGVIISAEQAEDETQLKQLTPTTPEEAERSIYPVRTRFLLWTADGVHIMWGVYGNGRFVATDNLGKRCWGIYGRGVFAGFYEGEFFWGKYENGAWKAKYLFGLENSYGKYVTFPSPVITNAATISTVP